MANLTIVIFGGPNGSGKSTITEELRKDPDFPQHYINADEIARRHRPATGIGETAEERHKREYQAMLEAEQTRLALVAKRESFAFETVMSHPSKVALIDHAKRQGYDVALHFVSTSDPAINLQRVADRVRAGGHNVDSDKVVERYHRSLSLLPAAAERADLTIAYDNSGSDRQAGSVARVVGGSLEVLATPPPAYYDKALIRPFTRERPSERAELRAAFGDIVEANLVNGQTSGRIVAATPHFLVQDHGRRFVLHDRAVLAACKLEPAVGRDYTLRYNQGNVVDEQRDLSVGRRR